MNMENDIPDEEFDLIRAGAQAFRESILTPENFRKYAKGGLDPETRADMEKIFEKEPWFRELCPAVDADDDIGELAKTVEEDELVASWAAGADIQRIFEGKSGQTSLRILPGREDTEFKVKLVTAARYPEGSEIVLSVRNKDYSATLRPQDGKGVQARWEAEWTVPASNCGRILIKKWPAVLESGG